VSHIWSEGGRLPDLRELREVGVRPPVRLQRFPYAGSRNGGDSDADQFANQDVILLKDTREAAFRD
jgi:hypothetical protein